MGGTAVANVVIIAPPLRSVASNPAELPTSVESHVVSPDLIVSVVVISACLAAVARVAAVATAWLVTEAAGTALSASAVRVSAATLAALPLPNDQQAWDIAAEAARNGDVAACGRAMLQAYAVDDAALFAWWWDRMPTR